MALDPSIILGAKTLDVNALYDQAQQARAQEQATQLNAMKLQEASQAMEERNKMRALFARPGFSMESPEAVQQMYQISPELGMKFETERADRQYKLNQAKKLDLDLKGQQYNKSIGEIVNYTNAQDALAALERNAANIDPNKYQGLKAELAAIGNDPEQFKSWRNKTIISILDAKDQIHAEQQADTLKFQQQKFADESRRGWANVDVAKANHALAERRLREETASGGGLTPQTVEYWANYVAKGGDMPAFGMGAKAAATRNQILTRVAEIGQGINVQGASPVSADAASGKLITARQDVAAQKQAVKAWRTGPQGNIVRSMNVAIDHLDLTAQLAKALDNGDMQAFNTVSQTLARATGSPAPTNLNAAAQIVGSEVTKAIVANGGGVTERQEAAKVFSDVKSPAQLRGAIATYKGLLGGQLKGLKRQYETSTGRQDFDSNLSPAAQQLVSPRATQPTAKTPGVIDFSTLRRK